MHQLSTLMCFNHIETIVPIITGLSSQCYQVNADNKKFFTKKLTTSIESTLSVDAALENISPKVIYHDQQWLITEFIDSNDLSSCSQPINEKISMAIKLMAKCHQLKTTSLELLPNEIAHTLINKIHFSFSQQNELKKIVNQLISSLTNTTHLVCCHGDLNFSNILFSSKSEVFLVDYECACTAPAEYDIAMFIAVNNLSRDKLTTITEYYKAHSAININLTLLNNYLLFCYFINSLWYVDAYHKTDLSKFARLAKQQWKNSRLENILNL
jgi:thiamine kinase-like enzyme